MCGRSGLGGGRAFLGRRGTGAAQSRPLICGLVPHTQNPPILPREVHGFLTDGYCILSNLADAFTEAQESHELLAASWKRRKARAVIPSEFEGARPARPFQPGEPMIRIPV